MLVSGQQQLKALTNQLKEASEQAEALNQKTEAIKAAGRRTSTILSATGRQPSKERFRDAKGRFIQEPGKLLRASALRQERENFKALRATRRTLQLKKLAVTETENQVRAQQQVNRENVKQLETQVQIDKTVELFNTRLAKFQRSRPSETRSNADEVKRLGAAGEQLQQAFAAAKKGGQENLRLLKTLADALGKLVEKQNELNRVSKLSSQGFERGRALQERVDTLEQSGLVGAPRLKAARSLSAAVIDAGNVGDATKYAKAVGKAEALVRRTEKEVQKIQKRLDALTSTQRKLNRFKSQELADQSALGKLQSLLDKAKEEALNGNIVDAKKITQEVENELEAQKNITRELKRQKTERNKTERKQKTAAKQRAAGRGKFLGGLASAVGFPLLFGGGIGSTAGGAIGSIAGSLLGPAGAFGGSILGSAIGQQLDEFAEKAKGLGKALRDPTNNIEELTKVLDIAGTRTSGLIKELESLGASEIAASVATNELNKRLKDFGLNPDDFTRQSKELENALARLGLAFTAFGAKFLLPIVNTLTNAVAGLAGARRRGPTATTLGAGNAVAGAARDSAISTAGFENIAEETALQQLIKQRLQDEKDIVDAKKQDLKVDKLQRATLEGNLALQAKTRQIIALNTRAKFEQNPILKKQLEREAEILEIQREQLEVTKQNSEARAAQQILFTTQQLFRQTDVKAAETELTKINRLLVDRDLIGRRSSSYFKDGEDLIPAFDLYNRKITEIRNIEEARLKELDNQIVQTKRLYNLSTDERAAKIDSLEQEKKLVQEVSDGLERQVKLDKTRLERAVLITQQAGEQARIAANQRVAAARLASPLGQFDSMNRSNLYQGFGFFTGTANLQSQQALAFTQQVQNFDRQIANLREQKIPGLDVADTAAIDSQIIRINQLRDAYIATQPELDKLALQQAAFNEALGISTPIAESFVSGLREVVAGTKSAQEAFADFLNTIADVLARKAVELIATYIAIGIAKRFAFGNTGDYGTGSETPLTGNIDFSSAFSGLANGGPAKSGNPYIVGERGPELFVPRSNGRVVPNGRFGGGGGGDVNVVVNVDAKGSNAQGSDRDAKALGSAIGIAVRSELVKQKRPGGLLAS